MPKSVKEFLFDQATGEINIEYDDNSTEKLNLSTVNSDIAAVEGRLMSDSSVLRNYRPGSLNRWKKARADVRSQAASSVVVFAGTSLLMGAYASGISSPNGSRPNGPNVRVAAELSRRGIACDSRSFIGNGYALGQAGNTLEYFDSRLSVTGGWVPNQTIGFTAGGHPVRSSAAGTISFSFSGAVDTVVIYEVQSNVFPTGSYSVNIDGTTVSASQSTNLSANSVRKVVLPCSVISAGVHTLNIVWESGTPAILGAEVYLSTDKTLRVISACAGSSTSADWARGQYAGAASWVIPEIIAPSLVLFDIGANDWIGGVNKNTFKSNIETAINGFLTESDVIAVTPFPTKDSATPRTTQKIYVDTLIDVCETAGIPYIDVWNDIGTWEEMSVFGKPVLTADSYHPGPAGSWEYPDRIVEALMSV